MEYRPNCFICPRCDSRYRWSDPGRVTVRVEPAVCFCGTNPVGACTQCGTAVCEIHHAELCYLLDAWQLIRRIYAKFDARLPKYAEEASSQPQTWKRAKPGWLFDEGGLAKLRDLREFRVILPGPIEPVFLTPLKDRLGWGDGALGRKLCLSCLEECFVSLGPFFDAQAGRLARQQRFCETCRMLRQRNNPKFGRHALPGFATGACVVCRQKLCERHFCKCPGCGSGLCQNAHGTFCPDCRWKPWRWF